MIKRRWQHLRMEQEDGFALVLAIVTTTVITILVVAMLSFTSSSSRDASLKQSRQSAYSLAEAGVNQALAQLASHYYQGDPPSPYQTDGKTPVNNSTVFDKSWLPVYPTVQQQQSPSSTTGCTTSSTCMAWTLVSCSFYTSTPPAGCSSLSGSDGNTRGILVLRGTGTVPNPTGAQPLKQLVTANVKLAQPPHKEQTPEYWQEIYTGAAPIPHTCNLSLGQGVTIKAPLYVAGNLCMTSSSEISGSKVTLRVFGWVWMQQQAAIGSNGGSAPRINSALIAGACSTSTGNKAPDETNPPAPHCTVNASSGNAQGVWDNTPPLTSPGHSAAIPTAQPLPDPLDPNSVAYADWMYAKSGYSSSYRCTDARAMSGGFELTPTHDYSCVTGTGSISYRYNASGSTLALDGAVYFPGDLTITTGTVRVQYSGIGSLFVDGSITAANNSYLCVKISSATNDCDFANATNSSSTGYWDATANLLLLQALGMVSGDNFHFQGGVYSRSGIDFSKGGGKSSTQGPLVSPATIQVGQQLYGDFPAFPQVSGGSFGTPPPPFTLSPNGGTF
jgi:hypothetical protein